MSNGLPLAFGVVAGLVATTIMRGRGSLMAPPIEVAVVPLSLYRWNPKRNRFDLAGRLPKRDYIGSELANRRRVAEWLKTFPLDDSSEDDWLLHVESAQQRRRDWFVLKDVIHRFDDEPFHGAGRHTAVPRLTVAGQSVTLRRSTR